MGRETLCAQSLGSSCPDRTPVTTWVSSLLALPSGAHSLTPSFPQVHCVGVVQGSGRQGGRLAGEREIAVSLRLPEAFHSCSPACVQQAPSSSRGCCLLSSLRLPSLPTFLPRTAGQEPKTGKPEASGLRLGWSPQEQEESQNVPGQSLELGGFLPEMGISEPPAHI